MKKTTILVKHLLYLFFLGIWPILVISPNLVAQQTTESVGFKVTTSSPGGGFSPRNIGAIWVEDSTGNFIKTLKLWADRRKQYLYTWNAATGGNVINAVTGATVSSHQAHEVSWDVTDTDGNVVPNGKYTLRIEMTDEHSQGPLSSFDFPVGDPTNVLSFPDEDNFHDIELSWNSLPTSVENEEAKPSDFQLYQNYPNPFNPSTEIKYSLPRNGEIELSVYNLFGQKMTTLVNRYEGAGVHTIKFDASQLPSGVYFYKIIAKDFTALKKMLLIR